ncbi:MAG: tetratricopeptide repeat protein [Ignavibacteria bacterium]|nr:tetratricopeptide repeat protein [Ignavibacteria bacterium]
MHKNILLILSVLFLFNFCSTVNDKELFDKAQKDQTEQKYAEAVAGYDKLLAEAPKSEFAPQALFECAKIYHAEKIPDLPKEESLNKAVQYYKKLYQDHPDFKDAPSAMMMSGFILANELNKAEEAKTIYEEFLKKYPESPLAGSVKLELESIGLSPDELLNRLARGTK